MKGHSSSIFCLNISLDGSIIASGDERGTIIVWELENCSIKAKYKGHKKSVRNIFISHDNSEILSFDFNIVHTS